MIPALLFSLLSFLVGADALAGQNPGVNLIFVGDAMQHQAQLDQALAEGEGKTHDYSECFTLIAPQITEADYAVCNLEVPLGGGPRYSGFPCFSAPDSYAEGLRDAGFDLFLTSNNHCLDSGDKAARRTLKALDRLGVDHIGTYHDAQQRDSLVPFIKDIRGIRFGFLNYTYGTNGIPPREGMEVAMIDRARIADEMRKTREAGADILCVTLHWGIEYVLNENEGQRDLAQFLIDNGADLIIGGHPHVVQPMRVHHNDKEDKDVLVVYSLGNFISNMKTTDTRGGALVKVRVERDSEGKAKFRNASYDLLYSAKPTGPGSNFKVIPSHLAPGHVPAAERQKWLLFERSARRLFDAENVGVPQIEHSEISN
ncbi:MAG: CapA family protein [Muribaculaceae bacterium]|nr:CapA family protein [Muribaculaceae bacterium]